MTNFDEQLEVLLGIYDQLPNNGKPSACEFTVLSGIFLHDSTRSCYTPLCLTTGTKCPSEADTKSSGGFMLSDCHSEALSRRSLILYLLSEIRRIINGYSSEVIEFNKATLKFRLREELSLSLLISDSPCGDSSIYLKSDEFMSYTGAKICDVDKSWIRENDQKTGAVRTKCGRSDIPEINRTNSLSCSDKILLWNVLGLQGAMLDNIMEPIYLATIVVGADPLANRTSQCLRLKESLVLRDSRCNQVIQCELVEFSKFPFSKCQVEAKARSNSDSLHQKTKIRACGYCINWIKDVDSTSKRIRNVAGGSLEVIIALTGMLQGATKRSHDDNDASISMKMASRLCRFSMAQLFDNIALSTEMQSFCPELFASLSLSSTNYEEKNNSTRYSSVDKWKNISSIYRNRKIDYINTSIFASSRKFDCCSNATS